VTRLLVQLSDTHIRRPGELAERRVDTAAALTRAVAAVNGLPQPADAVVVTGDLVDSGKPAQYEHLRALLAPLAAPVYLLPGNHDDRDALRAAFPDHAYLRASRRASLHYAVELEGLRLVVLDTSVTGAPHGELDAAQLVDLDATLARRPGSPTILAMHHPPFRTFIERMDDYGLQRGGPGLADVLARHPQVDRIVCGHLHRSIVARFAGRLAMTSPSTAHALAFDLGGDTPLAFTLEPAGFLVHAWSGASGIASHLVHVDAYDGPFDFVFA
jgi:3',5'-cyclic-AMP phosphodiesterase